MRLCPDQRHPADFQPEPVSDATERSTAPARVRTPVEVKKEFHERGIAVATWSDERGFPRALVYAVLNGRRKCLRGTSYDIAVALGLKPGAPRPVSES